MEDGAILDLYWARSDAAIRETDAKYGPCCRALAYRILDSREDAEECVSDAWLRAWNAIPPRRPERLGAFLAKITRNLALDRQKRDRAVRRGGGEVFAALSELEDCLPPSDPVAQAAELSVLTECLNRFLDGLKGEHRRVFLLRCWYLVPVRDIAAQMGYSEAKTASLLHRLRKRLRDMLKEEGIEV